MFFYSHLCSQFLFTLLKMGHVNNTKYLHMIRQLPQLHRFKLSSFVFALTLCVCVCWLSTHMCVLQEGVCVWAPEESGPWPGLPDTGGRAHWALILKHLAHVLTHTNKTAKQTLYYLLAPFLLTDASCPPVQTAQLQHHIDTRSVSLQVDLQARWKGRPALWFLSSFIFCYSWILFNFVSAQTESYNLSNKVRQKRNTASQLKLCGLATFSCNLTLISLKEYVMGSQ